MRRGERALGAALLTLGGCSLAPHYAPPPLSVPAAYKEAPAGWTVATPAAAPPAAWWTAFGDPELSDLEGRIEAANPSLAAAVARYDEALGQLGVSRADLFPQLGMTGSAERARLSARRPAAVSGAFTSNVYTVGASLSYEIDLFGRVRNQVRSSRGLAAASAAEIAGTRLGLQTQLASTYFQLRGADARLALLAGTVGAYQRAYDLTAARHAGGIASGLDINRARAQLSAARAEIAATRSQRAAYEHALAALIGVPPAGFSIPFAGGPVAAPPPLDGATPSVLLQRRPDIDAAERRVYAANARIGVARAAFFPALTLGASGGFETTGPALLSAASSFWALGPAAAALTLLDGGARRAQVRVARGAFDEAAADYKQTVLTAFRELEDDFAAAREEQAQERDLADAAQAADRTRDLALVRYREGASDYLEVVTAQTAALDAERSLIELRTQRLTTAVDTVRALGGPPRS